MENLWSEFRSAPSGYFQSSRTNPEAMVASMTQVLASEQEKRDQTKLTILGVWQEMCHTLFKDSKRLTNAIAFLKDLLTQQKIVASPLIAGQVLCTITTLLIEMELTLPNYDKELADFICLLFEYVEKIKSDSNHMIKSVACDCLRELEMTYPGLLSSKIGHFYSMSVAENTHIHQHYKILFATVLDHTVQKFCLEEAKERVSSPPLVDTLTDLLSYGDPLKSFKVPVRYRETADTILRKKVPRSSSTDVAKFSEVKKGLTFILDWSHLFTPSCLISTYLRLISCVQFTSFSPKILKRLFQHSPSYDIRLLQLMLLLNLKFGSEICDATDDARLKKRLLMLCGQSTLPNHHRALVWEWLIQWQSITPAPVTTTALEEGGEVDQATSYELELYRRVLRPSIFDSFELFFSKCRALNLYDTTSAVDSEPFGPSTVSDMVVNLLKPVRCGVMGRPAVTLYRVLYSQYISRDQSHHTPWGKETEKLVLDLVLKLPGLIPNTIDFIGSIQSSCPESPLPLNVMAKMVQFLASAPLDQLLLHFPLYLVFIKHALAHPQINPVVMLQLLSRVLSESTLCSEGMWDIGNTLVEICTTTMRVHTTDSVFKDLSDLLQRIAEGYNDLDIRDRASFYYQLMLTVSAGKLSAILTLASDSLSDIVEARISNSVFPSAPPVRKINDGSSFISVQRVPSTADTTWRGYQSTTTSPKKMAEGKEAVLEAYFQSLQYKGISSGQNTIHLHYQIKLFKKPPGITSNMIYGVVLSVSSNKHYHTSPDVYIPCLALDGNGSSNSTVSKVVTFTFQPKDPVPSKFDLSAVFSTEEGVTYSTTLSPITLNFTDLFLPLLPSIQEKVSAEVLFPLLWNHIESVQQSAGVLSDSSHGILSTVHLDCKANECAFQTSEILRRFSVELRNEDSTGNTRRFMIFLPPRYHLLLKFDGKTTSTNVAIATDNWRLLPLVNTLLHAGPG